MNCKITKVPIITYQTLNHPAIKSWVGPSTDIDVPYVISGLCLVSPPNDLF